MSFENDILANATANIVLGYTKATDDKARDKWLAAAVRVQSQADGNFVHRLAQKYPVELIRLGPTIGTAGVLPYEGEDWNESVRSYLHFENILGIPLEGKAKEMAEAYGAEIVSANRRQLERQKEEAAAAANGTSPASDAPALQPASSSSPSFAAQLFG